MAPKIYSLKEPLDLNRLRLSKPANRNGSPFIKMMDIDNPIYILGPKCTVKNGFVKSGKKVFCDFVFGNEDAELLEWLEKLEEKSQKLIYENCSTWFETPLDEHDIESSMSSPYKPYKSGKYFTIRVNVPTALDKINMKVYDENEKETDPENIKEGTKVLAVLEFQGIRCSVRSFQFEIELKQILIVEPEKIFETCVISKVKTYKSEKCLDIEPVQQFEQFEQSEQSEPVQQLEQPEQVQQFEQLEKLIESKQTDEQVQVSPIEINNQESNLDNLEVNANTEILENEIEIVDLPFDIIAADTETDPPLRLKNRNEVYYKLYKELRQRAKEAKREALANYLEAKRIKNAYLLEDVSDEEDDLEEIHT